MKKISLIFLVLLLALGIYLNRAYAHFFHAIGAGQIEPPHPVVTTITPTNEQATHNITYVALGDSLTAGVGVSSVLETYPYLLAKKFADDSKANVTFVNLGIPGATAETVLRDELPKVAAYHPTVVTLLVGINDMHNYVPITQFQETVRTIVRELNTAHIQVHLITIPYLGGSGLALSPYVWYFDWQTSRYNDALHGLSFIDYVPLIDLYTPTHRLGVEGGSYYSPDQFHPSASGYELWANTLYDRIHF